MENNTITDTNLVENSKYSKFSFLFYILNTLSLVILLLLEMRNVGSFFSDFLLLKIPLIIIYIVSQFFIFKLALKNKKLLRFFLILISQIVLFFLVSISLFQCLDCGSQAWGGGKVKPLLPSDPQ